MKFEDLSPADQVRATYTFIGACPGDGYDYERGALSRKKIVTNGTISVDNSTPITFGGTNDDYCALTGNRCARQQPIVEQLETEKRNVARLCGVLKHMGMDELTIDALVEKYDV